MWINKKIGREFLKNKFQKQKSVDFYEKKKISRTKMKCIFKKKTFQELKFSGH